MTTPTTRTTTAELDFLRGPVRDAFAARDRLAEITTGDVEYSHAAAASLFAQIQQAKILWVSDAGRWAAWNGVRWVMPADDLMRCAVRDFCQIYAAVASTDNRLGRGAVAIGRTIQSSGFAAAALKMLEADRRLLADAADFDPDPWDLNTPAGIVDLRTGAIRPHDPAALCTRCTAVAPAGDAERPRFDRFLAEVFAPLSEADRAETIRFVQASLGYCLTGDTAIHALYFWYGSGRNGKNTLGDLVRHCAGDYARKIPSNVLMASRFGERHPTEIAQLRGVRLAVSSEIEAGAYWDESRIKEVTGDDRLSARFMRQDFFEFPRTHKHLIFGNNKPRVRAVDAALRARMKLVGFGVDFEAAGRADPALPEALRAEAPGVLAWLIQGAAAVWTAGRRLPACGVVAAATDEYLTDADTLGLWIDECCRADDPAAWTQSSALYASYAAWKRDRNEPPLTQTAWSPLVQQRGFRHHKKGGGLRGFVGIQLLT